MRARGRIKSDKSPARGASSWGVDAMTRRELERLYDRHADSVFRYAVALSGTLSDARDLLRNVMIRLAGDSGGWDDLRDERAWLLSITRHSAIDHFRRNEGRRRHHERSGDASGALFMASDDPDLGAFRQGLEQAMRELPEEQRTAVYLKLWEEMSFDEIGRVCGIPPDTAANRYSHGVDRLRGALRPLYVELTP